MKTIIKGLRLSTIATIDDVLTPTWRAGELPHSEYEFLYDVELDESQLNLKDDVIDITDGNNYVILFDDSFVEISIT